MPKMIDPVDVQVGQRVRAYRLARQMSQTALAEEIGVTFQQVQKYEKGVNRIGSGRLRKIADVLAVGITTLFAERDAEPAGDDPLDALLARPYAARLLEAFFSIEDARLRFELLALTESLAGGLHDGAADGRRRHLHVKGRKR